MTVKELMEILKQYEEPDKVSFLEGRLKIVGRENDVSFIDEDRAEKEFTLIIGKEPILYEVCPLDYEVCPLDYEVCPLDYEVSNNGAFIINKYATDKGVYYES